MSQPDDLYSFVCRGDLAKQSLNTALPRPPRFGNGDLASMKQALSYDMLDKERLAQAQRMAVVYVALHAFENAVRDLVMKAMAEAHSAAWWEKVPEKIRKKVESRKDEEAKFRWHGSRGASDISYCDFGDLSSIIITNWPVFEPVLITHEWVKTILGPLERSRNCIMHGGSLANEDVERIGMLIRDWIRQTG